MRAGCDGNTANGPSSGGVIAAGVTIFTEEKLPLRSLWKRTLAVSRSLPPSMEGAETREAGFNGESAPEDEESLDTKVYREVPTGLGSYYQKHLSMPMPTVQMVASRNDFVAGEDGPKPIHDAQGVEKYEPTGDVDDDDDDYEPTPDNDDPPPPAPPPAPPMPTMKKEKETKTKSTCSPYGSSRPREHPLQHHLRRLHPL